jgi:predicted ATPase
VTPSSLSRAVYKARRALGDDGRRQRAISTVHGRGFRFVAPLRSDAAGESCEHSSDFVGRCRELAALERALFGKGGLALLSGERGIGKTRTVLEFVTRARAAGAEIHLVRCPKDPGAPAYWPWRQLARTLAEERDPLELRRLAGREAADFLQVEPGLASLGVEPPARLSPRRERFRLFESAVAVLRRVAGRRRLALVIDDFHRADLGSFAFLRHLTHSLPGLPLLVVLTFRDAHVAVDARRRGFLGESARSASAETFVLGALRAEEVASLAEKYLGGTLGEETLATLYRLSGGNPFFLRELLHLIEERGEEGLCSAAARPGALALAATVRSAVECQLTGIGAQARPLLTAAALLGDRFDLATLTAVGGTPPGELVPILEEALAAHLLEPVGRRAGRYRFAHGLLREALYEDLEEGSSPTPRRRRRPPACRPAPTPSGFRADRCGERSGRR